MPLRGIRGAVNVARNSRREIFTKTRTLLDAMVSANRIHEKDVAAAIFTLTPDLNADFPAYAARDMGWTTVPMMCGSELGVPGGMKRVVRIMLLVNTSRSAKAIRHQYLGETERLRPDLAKRERGITARMTKTKTKNKSKPKKKTKKKKARRASR